ncbi:MAG: type II secretion system protein GspE [Waddliaceae bacterium]|nr:type II secretion system protein GspE [Waddliaceae bacterium]
MTVGDSQISQEELLKQGALGVETACRQLAMQFDMEICEDLHCLQLPIKWYQRLPYSLANKHLILPIRENETEVIAALANPLKLDAIEELRLLLNKTVRAVYMPKELLTEAIQYCYNQKAGAASQFLADLSKDGEANSENEVYDLLDQEKDQAPLIKLLNLILSEAIQQGASDIHFEPLENDLRIRYRIDGVLQTRHCPAQEYQAQLITRLKVMAKMDIAERRLPQDGRIKLTMGVREIDFRVSTVPVVHGERVVLRILDKGNIVIGFDQLGMSKKIQESIKRLTRHPEGIFLVTGPTGSGKTTTLYSALSDIHSDEVNIMTVEDPVEYKLDGIAQIGVHRKIDLSFSKGLRHILRQDPDVVMIGEIRDRETAEIAVQASLTGHLVLSTLHTNDAPSAITRLVDMGIEPYLLSSTVVGVLAQRLVRTICKLCKEAYTPSDEELKDIGLSRSDLSEGTLYRGAGCKNCLQTGYRGRAGIYELMPVTYAVKKQLLASQDSVALRRVALDEGMQGLRESGRDLVIQGTTTIAEVLRVARGVEEGDRS